ncbi:LysR family transcriptional regulator [Paucilactobacillus nenjiangensis]|uniref:LysR family transcriptional regulator n=1 Tax=Paucilactobacillus nenjiangensis TaxID=1296540 RepID=UPI003BB4DA20
MNLTDLKVFVEIVNAKTITSAADNLFISSSTVGSHLKSLENELGYELLTRSKGSRSVTLTHELDKLLRPPVQYY